MYNKRRYVSYFVLLIISVILSGCSFSESSSSSSESSSNSSEGSYNSLSSIVSSPSKSSKKGERYQDEIVDYTYAYVKSSEADYESFQKGLADIASRQGIVNWEEDPNTYIAIGKGLRKAKIEGVAYETYKKNLAGADYGKMQDIQKGYDSE
jgi:hypothetical protein